MLFYKIEALFNGFTSEEIEIETETEIQEPSNSHVNHRRKTEFQKIIFDLFKGEFDDFKTKSLGDNKNLVFLSRVKGKKLVFGGLYVKSEDVEIEFNEYVKDIPINLSNIIFSEITFMSFDDLIELSCMNDILPNSRFILNSVNIRYYFEEFLIGEIRNKEKLITESKEILGRDTIVPELNRIFTPPSLLIKGHPVHYLISEKNKDMSYKIINILLEALYANKRISNRRYTVVEMNSDNNVYVNSIDDLYKLNMGGTLIIKYKDSSIDEDDDFKRPGGDIIVNICEKAIKYQREVLTVLCIPSIYVNAKNAFYENLINMTIIELKSDVVFEKDARSYLLAKAKTEGIHPDKYLYSDIRSNEGNNIYQLNDVFDRWYDRKIKTKAYPQYRHSNSIKESIKKESHKGRAIDELQKMVGLTSAKDVINNALNYYKIQKMYADMKINNERLAMHMVFTGNPGTAKTTVARLFARIMKENGLLEYGDLYEVGRSDLVGKYVGHTAPMVKEKFKVANGSVLFIDEAYSLVDDRDGMYGDEAINTIVQEMENNRNNMVVIFAGYPDRMEGFINKNPGLKSRIAFHINFDDYNEDELCEITKLIASADNMKLTPHAMDKAKKIFTSVKSQTDFGNGRFARNLFERAKLKQADRIIKMDTSKVTKDILSTIEVEDIVIPCDKKDDKRPIGFVMSTKLDTK